jgi:hypothetical protein
VGVGEGTVGEVGGVSTDRPPVAGAVVPLLLGTVGGGDTLDGPVGCDTTGPPGGVNGESTGPEGMTAAVVP